jgi:hypothetical protein
MSAVYSLRSPVSVIFGPEAFGAETPLKEAIRAIAKAACSSEPPLALLMPLGVSFSECFQVLRRFWA